MSLDLDLDCLDENLAIQNEGIDVPVFKPGTQDVLFTVGVMGPDSDQQRRAQERGAEEAVARGSISPPTREEQDEISARYLARCCFRWTLKDRSGNPVPFSEATAFDLIKKHPVIRQAVDLAAGNRARFTKRSPNASPEPSATA